MLWVKAKAWGRKEALDSRPTFQISPPTCPCSKVDHCFSFQRITSLGFARWFSAFADARSFSNESAGSTMAWPANGCLPSSQTNSLRAQLHSSAVCSSHGNRCMKIEHLPYPLLKITLSPPTEKKNMEKLRMPSWPQILSLFSSQTCLGWHFFSKVNHFCTNLLKVAFQPDLQQHRKGSTHPQSLGLEETRGCGTFQKNHQLITSKLRVGELPPQEATLTVDPGEKQLGFGRKETSKKKCAKQKLVSANWLHHQMRGNCSPLSEKSWNSTQTKILSLWPFGIMALYSSLAQPPKTSIMRHKDPLPTPIVQWDDIPNNFQDSQPIKSSSESSSWLGANEVGISEWKKIWEFIHLLWFPSGKTHSATYKNTSAGQFGKLEKCLVCAFRFSNFSRLDPF